MYMNCLFERTNKQMYMSYNISKRDDIRIQLLPTSIHITLAAATAAQYNAIKCRVCAPNNFCANGAYGRL